MSKTGISIKNWTQYWFYRKETEKFQFMVKPFHTGSYYESIYNLIISFGWFVAGLIGVIYFFFMTQLFQNKFYLMLCMNFTAA